jgi:hypothetical protein
MRLDNDLSVTLKKLGHLHFLFVAHLLFEFLIRIPPSLTLDQRPCLEDHLHS